jgi:hypothetical protein
VETLHVTGTALECGGPWVWSRQDRGDDSDYSTFALLQVDDRVRRYRVWQGVYHVPSEVGPLYVKFTAGVVAEFLLLSFKEKDDA